MRTKTVFGAALVAATLTLGCGDDEDFFDTPPPQTLLRAVHGAPLAGNIDVYIDGELVGANVPYRAASEYFTPLVGNASLVITQAGNSNQVLFSSTPGLDINFDYTAILLSGAVANTATGVFVVDDDTQPSFQGTEFHLVNGFENAGNVDVYIYPANTQRPATPTVGNLAFANVAAPQQLAGGNYQVQITRAGNPANVLFFQDQVSLDAGQDYIFVVEPAQGNNGEAEILSVTGQSDTFVIPSDAFLLQ
jgi:hypothetical protein